LETSDKPKEVTNMQRQKVITQTLKGESRQSAQPQRQLAEDASQRRLAEEARQRLVAEHARQQQLGEEATRLRLAAEVKLQKIQEYKTQLESEFRQILSNDGYLPPEPAPLLWSRALKTASRQVQARTFDSDFSEALAVVERELEDKYQLSYGYLQDLRKSLAAPPSLLQKIKLITTRVHKSIEQATVSIEMPEVAPSLKTQMSEIELFLAGNWVEEKRRGILAIHIDEASQSTILQIGIAEHGPIYITIPEVLRPEDLALKSVQEMLRRLGPFRNVVDPMAVIDGSHQGLNYNQIFLNSRVVRAPSGNTSRLAKNYKESALRERLTVENTVILNSAPSTREAYARVFKKDLKARSWPAWEKEAQLWNDAVVSNRFATSQEVSREALVDALSLTKNVIVIVAHCDGGSIFMPEPPPEGSEVPADYLIAHREQIAANAPFVYLFSCEAGKLSNLQNFASTLLECGASGVVASQSDVGSAEGRALLERVLGEGREAPPIEDYFRAMRDVNFRDMEVFLA
jgi:hypothetical protein